VEELEVCEPRSDLASAHVMELAEVAEASRAILANTMAWVSTDSRYAPDQNTDCKQGTSVQHHGLEDVG
jgi:hypothetical protein